MGFQHGGKTISETYNTMGRNLRTVWTIPTQPYPEAHFATFPEALVEPCIKAGTSEKGCCATCGAAWERILSEAVRIKPERLTPKRRPELAAEIRGADGAFGREPGWRKRPYDPGKTIGFRPTCDHIGDPVPCVILDPFAGSGTVGKVARDLGRSSILIEIKGEYIELIKKRTDYAHKAIDAFIKD